MMMMGWAKLKSAGVILLDLPHLNSCSGRCVTAECTEEQAQLTAKTLLPPKGAAWGRNCCVGGDEMQNSHPACGKAGNGPAEQAGYQLLEGNGLSICIKYLLFYVCQLGAGKSMDYI